MPLVNKISRNEMVKFLHIHTNSFSDNLVYSTVQYTYLSYYDTSRMIESHAWYQV